MKRLVLGSVLLVATATTGALFGSTGEPRVRVPNTRPPVPDSVAAQVHDGAAALAPVPVPVDHAPAATSKSGADGSASVKARPVGSPEADDLVDRMRRHLPRLGDDAAQRIRSYHVDYKQKLRDHSWEVTSALLDDPESRRRAVESMRGFKRKREDFLRGVLGRGDYDAWKKIERTGGRDTDQLVRQLVAHER